MELRGNLCKTRRLLVEGIGGMSILFIWFILTEFKLLPSGILPSPVDVFLAFGTLFAEDNLIANIWYSFSLNTYGLIEAIIISLPIGFAIGLDRRVKALFERYTVLIRFLPLTAVTGLFISWFGIGDMMKIQFLAFSIFVYLVPAIIQRINEVPDVYIQTVETLGASKWQVIKFVFIPSVLSSVWDDIKALAALSWTYVVVVELINTRDGGVGAMSYLAARQLNGINKVYAILITIMIIGLLQDKLFTWLGKIFFPHKVGKLK